MSYNIDLERLFTRYKIQQEICNICKKYKPIAIAELGYYMNGRQGERKNNCIYLTYCNKIIVIEKLFSI